MRLLHSVAIQKIHLQSRITTVITYFIVYITLELRLYLLFLELTWHYNCELLPDREVKCFCGSKNCRGRLL